MVNLKNLDIRNKITESNLKYWEIAQELGITDSTFSRKLRREFSNEEKIEIFKIINMLEKEGEKDDS